MPKQTHHNPIYASSDTIQQLIDVGRDTLESWEAEKKIIEGVHFTRIGRVSENRAARGERRYVVQLMIDRVANWDDDVAHQRAIDHWLRSLPSNQSKSSGKRDRRISPE